jgi:hypothetical protein
MGVGTRTVVSGVDGDVVGVVDGGPSVVVTVGGTSEGAGQLSLSSSGKFSHVRSHSDTSQTAMLVVVVEDSVVGGSVVVDVPGGKVVVGADVVVVVDGVSS